MAEVVAEDGEERIRYHKDVDTLAADHPWHRIHARIKPGDTVLDVGCGSGGLGQLVGQTAGDVDGIELNEDRATEARLHLRSVVNAPGGPEADALLPGPYDVVIFADVLEHITEPAPTLEWAATKLAADGRILALIPNDANWKVRRKILKGDWSYADTGYFDRDHVRFLEHRDGPHPRGRGRAPRDGRRVRAGRAPEAAAALDSAAPSSPPLTGPTCSPGTSWWSGVQGDAQPDAAPSHETRTPRSHRR